MVSPPTLLPVFLLCMAFIFSSCASLPEKTDREDIPIMFTKEILERDFPGRVFELRTIGRIGQGEWTIDREEPRYG